MTDAAFAQAGWTQPWQPTWPADRDEAVPGRLAVSETRRAPYFKHFQRLSRYPTAQHASDHSWNLVRRGHCYTLYTHWQLRWGRSSERPRHPLSSNATHTNTHLLVTTGTLETRYPRWIRKTYQPSICLLHGSLTRNRPTVPFQSGNSIKALVLFIFTPERLHRPPKCGWRTGAFSRPMWPNQSNCCQVSIPDDQRWQLHSLKW